MPLSNPYARYKQTAVNTADGGDLLVMSYEALLRWLARADEAIDAAKIVEAHDALMAAQDIVANLVVSLDFERGGGVAQNLARLYDFVCLELIKANVGKDKAVIASVRELVIPLLDAWRMAVMTARKEGQLASA